MISMLETWNPIPEHALGAIKQNTFISFVEQPHAESDPNPIRLFGPVEREVAVRATVEGFTVIPQTVKLNLRWAALLEGLREIPGIVIEP